MSLTIQDMIMAMEDGAELRQDGSGGYEIAYPPKIESVSNLYVRMMLKDGLLEPFADRTFRVSRLGHKLVAHRRWFKDE